jgi:splicing factor 3B subunit 2
MSNQRRLTKNEKRREKKKLGKSINGESQSSEHVDTTDENLDVEIEYISAPIDIPEGNEIYDQFKEIFEKFSKPEVLTAAPVETGGEVDHEKDAFSAQVDNGKLDQVVPAVKKLSKKKKKLMSRLSVAELKQLVARPDVVEAHDVTSSDPRLLVFLKAYRNTVPVPRHWCHKRKYLQGKRGVEKAPFQLPEYIADTGIAKIRESVLESESLKKSKQKARDKLQPKMGKIDIDYQVLHDAFFKFATKPKMSHHGDLYYEGKEFEVLYTYYYYYYYYHIAMVLFE